MVAPKSKIKTAGKLIELFKKSRNSGDAFVIENKAKAQNPPTRLTVKNAKTPTRDFPFLNLYFP